MSSIDGTNDDALDARLTAEQSPRLAWFLAAYLHEDLAVEQGSAAAAAWSYAAEAELDELGELATEWDTLVEASQRWPLDRVNELLRTRFGSAWRATTAGEFEAVAFELHRALRE